MGLQKILFLKYCPYLTITTDFVSGYNAKLRLLQLWLIRLIALINRTNVVRNHNFN